MSDIKEEMEECGIKELELMGAKRDIGGYMWCHEYLEFVKRGEDVCGKIWCGKYNPCNGRSGRCRHLKNSFTETGQKYLLTASGLKEV